MPSAKILAVTGVHVCGGTLASDDTHAKAATSGHQPPQRTAPFYASCSQPCDTVDVACKK
mgnify:CR=1 FL=1